MLTAYEDKMIYIGPKDGMRVVVYSEGIEPYVVAKLVITMNTKNQATLCLKANSFILEYSADNFAST